MSIPPDPDDAPQKSPAETGEGAQKTNRSEQRADKLAAALRANLRRRKAVKRD